MSKYSIFKNYLKNKRMLKEGAEELSGIWIFGGLFIGCCLIARIYGSEEVYSNPQNNFYQSVIKTDSVSIIPKDSAKNIKSLEDKFK